jgi:hypothetical protein
MDARQVVQEREHHATLDLDGGTIALNGGRPQRDTVPFVDKAAVWAYRRGINPPTVETLYRLNMDVEINLE